MNRRSVRPRKRLLWALLLMSVLACLVAVSEAIWPALGNAPSALGGLLLGAVLLWALVDLGRSWHAPAVEVERLVPGSLGLMQWSQVRLRVRYPERRPLMLAVYDHYSAACEAQGLPAVVHFQSKSLNDTRGVANTEQGDGAEEAGGAEQVAEVSYRVRPQARGLAEFKGVELRVTSVLGLWELQFFAAVRSEARIYPNFSALAGYGLLAADRQVGQMGIRPGPRRGAGTEFHQLREYQTGDATRQIDWKATSRRLQLIAREYQDERDQQVVLMLDSGRRLRTRDGTLSHFDQALNASLMLAYVALRQGDAVAMMSFGRGSRWVPAVKGAANLHRLLNGFYDLHAGAYASDYVQAARDLMQRQRKRALVVLVTNLRDEDVEDVLLAIRLLRKRHLVLVANLREQALDEVLEAPIAELTDALRYSGTRAYLEQRREMQERLQGEAVMVLDCSPAELQVQVINRYLQVKRAGRL